MSRKQRVSIGVFGLLLVLAVVFAVGVARSGPGDEELRAGDHARPVPTAPVRQMMDDRLRSFPGKVRATRRVDLAFPVAGLLDILEAREGSRVSRGGLLARLDQRDFVHEVDAAKAKCALAQRRLDRMRSLLSSGAVTEDDYEDAQTAYEVALSDLRIREKALADTVLMAPFDGVVVSREMENHEHVEAQQTIVSLQDISLVEVVIQVPEGLLAHEGAEGLKTPQVRFDADATRWFDAAIREYNAESDKVTRTYDVVVALPPPADMRIYPGMTATVRARVREEMPPGAALCGLLVPVEAVWKAADGWSYVWVIDAAGGAPRKVRVEVLAMEGDEIAVCGDVEPGMLVAVAGLHSLDEHGKVRPMKDGKEGLDG